MATKKPTTPKKRRATAPKTKDGSPDKRYGGKSERWPDGKTKDTTYLMKLNSGDKARWQAQAEAMEISLAEWITRRCNRKR